MYRLILAPPRAAAHLVRYFHVEAPGPHVAQVPAHPYTLLKVCVSGAGYSAVDGVWEPTPEAAIGGPYNRPQCYRALPGTVFVIALLNPGQAAHLFGIQQDRLADARWPLAELVGAHAVAQLLDEVRRYDAPSDWTRSIAAWLHERNATPAMSRSLLAPNDPSNWLYPAHELAGRQGISMRQFERRFVATYGMSQRSMRRMARFVGALGKMMSGRVPDSGLTRLALDCGYFDQAHMTRDFLALAGSPPQRLTKDAHSDPRWSTFRYAPEELDLVLGSERI